YKNYRIISTHEIPLSVIFDNIIPTSEIPFISYSNMYKYMIDFIPDSTMNISMNNTILLKRKSDTDFLDILLFIENSKIIIEYSVSTTESYENVFEFIKQTLNFDFENITISQTGIQGLFFFLGYTIEQYTFSDFIMNNPLASSYFSIGEFLSISKKNASSRIYFNNHNITAIFSQKILMSSGIDNKYISKLISQ